MLYACALLLFSLCNLLAPLQDLVTRRDQLASKAKKKEDEPRSGRGRGRARGRGKGPGRGRGRRAEPAAAEDECDDDEEMEGDDGEGCEHGEKGAVESSELGKVPKKLRPFVVSKPKTSRAASSSKPSTSRASSSKTKPSAKAKASSKPKTSRASSSKAKKEPGTSRASSSKAKKEPGASRASSSKAKKEPEASSASSSKAKKEPGASRASSSKARKEKGAVKVCSEGDGEEPMDTTGGKSKKNKKVKKRRILPENDSSRPAARPRRGQSVLPMQGNLQKEIGEIQSFTEALDYNNLEFDDLKFYTKEAVTQQFEFKITQLNIYWKTARCGIKMYRADGKFCDPFSFTFPTDAGTHLLRMVVSVAAAAHMVTSLYL